MIDWTIIAISVLFIVNSCISAYLGALLYRRGMTLDHLDSRADADEQQTNVNNYDRPMLYNDWDAV